MYDWANSAFQTTIIAAVFPIYFHNVVAADLGDSGGDEPLRLGDDARDRDRRAGRAAPRRHRRLCGDEEEDARRVRRDRRRSRRSAMFWIRARRLAARADAVRASATSPSPPASCSTSRSSRISSARAELDRVSSAGYAIGYLGGGVLLAINLLMIQRPAWFGIPDAGTAVRLSLASVGIWWLRVLDSALPQGARAGAADRGRRISGRQRSSAPAPAVSSQPSTSCGATSRHSCCSSRSSSTTTASRRSSGWRRRSAARSASTRTR